MKIRRINQSLDWAIGDQEALGIGLVIALRVFGTAAALWRKTKSTISARGNDNPYSDFETGKIETNQDWGRTSGCDHFLQCMRPNYWSVSISGNLSREGMSGSPL